jgi:hypothetical protein
MDDSMRTLMIGLLWHSITSNGQSVGMSSALGQMLIITEATYRVGTQIRFIVIETNGKTFCLDSNTKIWKNYYVL